MSRQCVILRFLTFKIELLEVDTFTLAANKETDIMLQLPRDSGLQCLYEDRVFDRCVPVTELFPPAYYQRKCLHFEAAWKLGHNGTLGGLISSANPW